jgi:hypothetical protein
MPCSGKCSKGSVEGGGRKVNERWTRGPDSSGGIVTRLCAARSTICGSIPGKVKIASWGSIQLSIKWFPLDLSSEIKRTEREADHLTPSVLRWERVELYLHYLTSLRGIHTETSLNRTDEGTIAAYFRVLYRNLHWMPDETQNNLSWCSEWDPTADILCALCSTATWQSFETGTFWVHAIKVK